MKKLVFVISFALCLTMAFNIARAQETGYGYITGKIMTSEGYELSDATVNFYNVTAGPSPSTNEYWPLQDFSAPIADDGTFLARLPAGAYHLIAIKKISGKSMAPPAEGDIIYPPRDSGEPKTYVITPDVTIDAGVLSGAVPFKKEWVLAGKTGIEGVVFNVKGEPAEGILVAASLTPTLKGILYISDRKTGADGTYIVRVPEGGAYYVTIAEPNQTFTPVTVSTGQITRGANIHLTK